MAVFTAGLSQSLSLSISTICSTAILIYSGKEQKETIRKFQNEQ